jgi:hypothetical protein
MSSKTVPGTETVIGEGTPEATKQGKHAQLKAPWKKGMSGNPNGRPKGSRNVLSQAVFTDLLNYYEENGNGLRIIDHVAKENPVAFLQLIVRLMPRHATLEITGGNVEVTLSAGQKRRIAEGWLVSQNLVTKGRDNS